VPHSYSGAELRLDAKAIREFALSRGEAIERFCADAGVSPEAALRKLYRVFDLLPRPELPSAELLFPRRGLLFAIDLAALFSRCGEDLWRRIDLAVLSALSGAAGASEISVWAHLGEGLFGLFFVGDLGAEAAGRIETTLAALLPGALTAGGELEPTDRAYPAWALREGKLWRYADDDPDEGAALLVVVKDGADWVYEAYEIEGPLPPDVVDPLEGVGLGIARIKYLD
jgi:hypothetical protein